MRSAMRHALLLICALLVVAADLSGAATTTTVSLTLKHQGTPVPFTIYLPPVQSPPSMRALKLPTIFLLQGFNVEAAQYSELLKLLAARGYPVVASDYFRPLPPGLPASTFPPKNGCRPNDFLQTSIALLPTLLRHISHSSDQQLKDIAAGGVVLFGHSNGGAAGATAMDKGCSTPVAKSGNTSDMTQRYCQGYDPMFAAGNGVLATLQEANNSSSAAPAHQQQQRAGRILGAVLYEGYLSVVRGPANTYSSIVPGGVSLPPGTFVAYLSGAYNNNTLKGYTATLPESPRGCASFARFAVVNHFGSNNWQAGGVQVTPCARAASSDPTTLRVSKEVQERALRAMAGLIDDTVRSDVFGDAAATERLRDTQRGAQKGGGVITDVRFSKSCPAH